jgi:hypothetical protein
MISAIVAAAITAYGNQASAQSQPERVAAREFVVVDANGSERASLGLRDNGEVNVRFTDTSGVLRLNLGAGTNPALRLLDPTGAPGFLLGSGDNGEGAAIIMGPNNQVLLQSPRQGQGFLMMSGPSGFVSLGTGGGRGGDEPPRLTMSGGGRVDVDFEEGGPSIRLSRRQETIWRAP